MATLEERVARIEQENAELKKAVELMNITLGALVSKATLEKLNEKNDKLFDTLIRHDQFTNQQLTELRGQLTETDGKVVGLQTEMCQRFEQQGGQIVGVQVEIVGVQTEMRQRFEQQGGVLQQILDRLPPPQ